MQLAWQWEVLCVLIFVFHVVMKFVMKFVEGAMLLWSSTSLQGFPSGPFHPPVGTTRFPSWVSACLGASGSDKLSAVGGFFYLSSSRLSYVRRKTQTVIQHVEGHQPENWLEGEALLAHRGSTLRA